MFAVVQIAGFQEKVKAGDKLHVPTLDTEQGKNVTFDKVLMLSLGEGDMLLGTPYVAGASVDAKVIGHGRDEKIRVVKHRRRKRYTRVKGHRQGYTEIEILKIHGGKQ